MGALSLCCRFFSVSKSCPCVSVRGQTVPVWQHHAHSNIADSLKTSINLCSWWQTNCGFTLTRGFWLPEAELQHRMRWNLRVLLKSRHKRLCLKAETKLIPPAVTSGPWRLNRPKLSRKLTFKWTRMVKEWIEASSHVCKPVSGDYFYQNEQMFKINWLWFLFFSYCMISAHI